MKWNELTPEHHGKKLKVSSNEPLHFFEQPVIGHLEMKTGKEIPLLRTETSLKSFAPWYIVEILENS